MCVFLCVCVRACVFVCVISILIKMTHYENTLPLTLPMFARYISVRIEDFIVITYIFGDKTCLLHFTSINVLVYNEVSN